jgi:hypothetical protein
MIVDENFDLRKSWWGKDPILLGPNRHDLVPFAHLFGHDESFEGTVQIFCLIIRRIVIFNERHDSFDGTHGGEEITLRYGAKGKVRTFFGSSIGSIFLTAAIRIDGMSQGLKVHIGRDIDLSWFAQKVDLFVS